MGKEDISKEAIKSVVSLGKQGIVGIIVMLILGITTISFYSIKMSSNHINHFTEAVQGFESSMRENSTMTSQALIDNTAVLSEIKGKLD